MIYFIRNGSETQSETEYHIFQFTNRKPKQIFYLVVGGENVKEQNLKNLACRELRFMSKVHCKYHCGCY